MATQMSGQPIYILQEGAQRFTGKDARRMNIMAAKVIAEAIKTTLGPRGMDKMLVDGSGNAVITNDGAAILKEVEVKHPSAKMMVEVAKTVEKEVGDGTTTAVILAGELLKRAEGLLDLDIHATVISKGYKLAGEEALKILEKQSIPLKPDDRETLIKIAYTALNSKAPGITAKDHLAKLSVDAVRAVGKTAGEKTDGGIKINKDSIKIQKQVGESTKDSELISGVVIDKERTHSSMPKTVENARILLLSSELKIKKSETDAKLDITSPEQLKSFLDEEEDTIKRMVEDIKKTGTNCLFCKKSIDDTTGHLLSKEGIFAVKSLNEKDMKLIAKATGAKITTSTKDISKEDLGRPCRVEERKVGTNDFTFITGCEKPEAVTLFIRGGTEHVVDEVERSLDDSVSVVKDVIEEGKIIPGGGASMIALSKGLQDFANKVSGREQLAVMEFAKSMEVIPRTLAENAGLDPIDVIIKLYQEHEKGNTTHGIDVSSGKATDMFTFGVIEPLKVRTQSIRSAVEVAIMIMRIDDVIAAKGSMGPEE
jgi:archaeal chaperonin